MPMTADLTIRETAALSGVSLTTIEKSVESHVLQPVAGPPRVRGGSTRFLPVRAVVYFHALKAANLTDLPLRHKRSIWNCMARLEPMKLEAIEFTPGATLHLEHLAGHSLREAERYRRDRDRYIASNPGILGGTPVIAGTRVTVHSVLERLQDGETVDDILEDYPDVPRQAIAAAELYARSHPLRGRPSGRPWRS